MPNLNMMRDLNQVDPIGRTLDRALEERQADPKPTGEPIRQMEKAEAKQRELADFEKAKDTVTAKPEAPAAQPIQPPWRKPDLPNSVFKEYVNGLEKRKDFYKRVGMEERVSNVQKMLTAIEMQHQMDKLEWERRQEEKRAIHSACYGSYDQICALLQQPASPALDKLQDELRDQFNRAMNL